MIVKRIPRRLIKYLQRTYYAKIKTVRSEGCMSFIVDEKYDEDWFKNRKVPKAEKKDVEAYLYNFNLVYNVSKYYKEF